MFKEIFHSNILSEIAKFINYKDLLNLMLSCKNLLYQIGKSDIWTKSVKLFPKQLEKFQDILPILLSNPLTKNKICFREYYDVHYYLCKFLHREIYVSLADLLTSSETDRENYSKVIEYLRYDDGYRFCEFEQNLLVLKNSFVKKIFHSIPEEIMDLILVDESLDLSMIIVNVDNENHPLKIISGIGFI